MDNNIQTHESFGTIQFSRCQGTATTLFGSSIKHSNTITCKISNCELERKLNTDWFHPTSTVLEFEMSHTQFANMLTNINSNPVPITFTLKPVGELKKCEEPPYESIIQKHANEFEDHLETINEKTKDLIELLNETLENSKIKKADKEKLTSLAKNLITEIQANSQYQLKAFNEQMNKTVIESKNELDAMIQNKNLTNTPKLIE